MVSKFLDLKNLSWQSWPFLLSNNRRKVWATVLFLSAIIHRKVIHVNCFVFFFLPYLKDHGLLRSWNFAAIATRRNDFRDLCYVYKILPPGGNNCKSVKRSRNDRNARRRVVSPSKAASLIRQTIYAVSSWFCEKRCYNVGALKLQVCRVFFCDKWYSFPPRQKKNKQDSFVMI